APVHVESADELRRTFRTLYLKRTCCLTRSADIQAKLSVFGQQRIAEVVDVLDRHRTDEAPMSFDRRCGRHRLRRRIRRVCNHVVRRSPRTVAASDKDLRADERG